MTPQETAAFAASHQEQPAKVQEFLLAASPREIQEFTHLIPASDPHRKYLHLARVALDVRLAEDQAKAMEQLQHHTEVLLNIAKSLLDETKLLRWLTVILLVFTAALLVFTICPVIHP
jgi:hypothetical protein